MSTDKELKPEEAKASEDAEVTRYYRPDVDIIETKDGIDLVVDMPGVDEGSIDISFEDRVLTIRGRMEERAPEGSCKACGEYGEGMYERSFTVSEDIDGAGIEGTYKDGVLTILLPKSEAAKTRKVAVKAG